MDQQRALETKVKKRGLSDLKTAVVDVSIPLVARRWMEGERGGGVLDFCPWKESGCGGRGGAYSIFSTISWK